MKESQPMDSSFLLTRKLLSRMAIAASVVMLTCLPYTASAEPGSTTAAATTNGSTSYSSSADWRTALVRFDYDGAPKASASARFGQYGQQNNRYPYYQSRWSHLAFEVGGGLTSPVGTAANGTASAPHGFETYGYNFTVGGGWNFNKRFGVLLEYQFNKNKI